MVEMFSLGAAMRDPKDITLVIEVTLQQISDWVVYQAEGLPNHLMQRMHDLAELKKGLSPLYDEMRDGDSLWLCRSHEIGPLYGHEGIALVRNRQPVIYIRVVQY
jgi:hypothetical protein